MGSSGGPKCGACYELTIKDGCGNVYGGCNEANNKKAVGKKFTVMNVGKCWDANACPPTAG